MIFVGKLLLIFILFQIKSNTVQDIKIHYRTSQLSWMSENNLVMVQKKIFRLDDYHQGPESNYRIYVYDIKTKEKKYILNKDFRQHAEYYLSYDGKYILENSRLLSITIYKNLKEIYRIDLRKRFPGFTNQKGVKCCYIDKDNAYFSINLGDGFQPVRFNLNNKKIFFLSEEKNIFSYSFPDNPAKIQKVIFSQRYKNEHFICQPIEYKLKKIDIPIPCQRPYFLGIVGNNIYFIASEKKFNPDLSKKNRRVYIYNQKTKKTTVFSSPSGVDFLNASKNYIATIYYYNNYSICRLYNQSGKLLWKKKLQSTLEEYPFALISPSENKIALWYFSGKISVYDISYLKKNRKPKP